MGVRIEGIQAAVPSETKDIGELEKLWGRENAERITKTTGVKTRHVVSEGLGNLFSLYLF